MSAGHGGGGSERWLVSYADFITLLMVLFVVLYSMSQIDVERYKQLAESLRAAFAGGPARVVDPSINQAGVTGGDSAPAPIILDDIPPRPPDTLDVVGRMTSLLLAYNLASDVSVHNNIEGVLISLSERLLFEPGTADLRPEAYPVLDTVAEMIRPLENEVRVIGYTDDQPPVDPRYPNNWYLSTARAITIVEYLITRGVPPQRLSAAGRGEYQPLFPNDTPEHRALNSRAEIIIVYPVETEQFQVNVLSDLSVAEAALPEPQDTGGH